MLSRTSVCRSLLNTVKWAASSSHPIQQKFNCPVKICLSTAGNFCIEPKRGEGFIVMFLLLPAGSLSVHCTTKPCCFLPLKLIWYFPMEQKWVWVKFRTGEQNLGNRCAWTLCKSKMWHQAAESIVMKPRWLVSVVVSVVNQAETPIPCSGFGLPISDFTNF